MAQTTSPYNIFTDGNWNYLSNSPGAGAQPKYISSPGPFVAMPAQSMQPVAQGTRRVTAANTSPEFGDSIPDPDVVNGQGYTYHRDRQAVFNNAAKAESAQTTSPQLGPPTPGKTSPGGFSPVINSAGRQTSPGANAIALRDQYLDFDRARKAPLDRADAETGLLRTQATNATTQTQAQAGLMGAEAEGARQNIAGTQRQNADYAKQIKDLTGKHLKMQDQIDQLTKALGEAQRPGPATRPAPTTQPVREHPLTPAELQAIKGVAPKLDINGNVVVPGQGPVMSAEGAQAYRQGRYGDPTTQQAETARSGISDAVDPVAHQAAVAQGFTPNGDGTYTSPKGKIYRIGKDGSGSPQLEAIGPTTVPSAR